MNFRQLDLNLLRVLAAVYRTGSVTEAGRQLALSQPATSNALARLRRFLGDELFVRSPRGLHPTHVAQRVAPAVIAHLQGLESTVLGAAEAFDPAVSEAHWRLSLSDLGEILFLPALVQALRQEAPNCQLSNVAVAASEVSAALEARDIDLAVGIIAPEWKPPIGAAGRALSARQLSQVRLAVTTPAATVHGSVEVRLKQLKLASRARLHVRHYGAVPELVTRTDLLAIVPRMFAESLHPRFAVRIWELPDVGPQYEVRMLWHPSAQADAAHAWLRALLRRLYERGTPDDPPRRRARR